MTLEKAIAEAKKIAIPTRTTVYVFHARQRGMDAKECYVISPIPSLQVMPICTVDCYGVAE